MSFFGAGFFGQGYFGPNYWGPSGVPPAPVADQSTPGRLRHSYEEYVKRQGDLRQEQDQSRRDRAAPALPPSSDRAAEYVAKSEKITQAIATLRAEQGAIAADSERLREQIAEAQAKNRAKAQAKAEHELMLKEQAAVLAKAQEAALLEELEVLDIAYVALIALAMVMQ